MRLVGIFVSLYILPDYKDPLHSSRAPIFPITLIVMGSDWGHTNLSPGSRMRWTNISINDTKWSVLAEWDITHTEPRPFGCLRYPLTADIWDIITPCWLGARKIRSREKLTLAQQCNEGFRITDQPPQLSLLVFALQVGKNWFCLCIQKGSISDQCQKWFLPPSISPFSTPCSVDSVELFPGRYWWYPEVVCVSCSNIIISIIPGIIRAAQNIVRNFPPSVTCSVCSHITSGLFCNTLFVCNKTHPSFGSLRTESKCLFLSRRRLQTVTSNSYSWHWEICSLILAQKAVGTRQLLAEN